METATAIQERLHRQEISLADARLERATAPEAALKALSEALAAIDTRFADLAHGFETRLEDLRNDTGEKLLSLAGAQAEHAAPDFAAFRGEVENRLAAIERRSVRALEQLTESVALLSKRGKEESEESLARSA
jgi:hypothetical protein